MKPFKSRLFNRTIHPNAINYWNYLQAEILFLLKELEDMKCPCSKCYADKHNFEWRISEMGKDGKIEKNFRPSDDDTVGYCGRAPHPPNYTLNKPKT
jgi:hypothetical protein